MRPQRLLVTPTRVVCSEPGTHFDSLDHLADAVRAEVEAAPADAVHVVLAEPLLQRRTLVDLPPVRRTDLRRLVAEEPHRFFRRRPTPLEIDAGWNESSPEAPSTATAVAVECGILERLLAGLESAGVTPLSIRPEQEEGPRLRFEPGEVRVRRRGWVGRRVRPWIAVAIFPWLLASAVYVLDLQRDLIEARNALDSLHVETDRLEEIEERVADVGATTAALRRASTEGAWASPLLTRVAGALPESVYAVSLSLRPGAGRGVLRAPEGVGFDSLILSPLDVNLEVGPGPDPRRTGWSRVVIRLGGGP